MIYYLIIVYYNKNWQYYCLVSQYMLLIKWIRLETGYATRDGGTCISQGGGGFINEQRKMHYILSANLL
jgi:hypothetical protein